MLARLEPNEPRHLRQWAKQQPMAAEEIAARVVFQADLAPLAAEVFAAIGDGKRAREYYRRALRLDPTARQPESHFAFARILLKDGEYGAARQVLRRAARNPAAECVPVIVELLISTSRLDSFEREIADFPLLAEQWVALRRAVCNAQLDADRFGVALALCEEHPEILDASLARRLREAARAVVTLARCVGVLERALSQGAPLTDETSAAFADLAESELSSLQVETALVHLQRAHELQPALWRAAEKLAGLYLDGGDARKAAETIKAFLAGTKDDAERAQAQQLLGRIPGT